MDVDRTECSDTIQIWGTMERIGWIRLALVTLGRAAASVLGELSNAMEICRDRGGSRTNDHATMPFLLHSVAVLAVQGGKFGNGTRTFDL
jgi:hypothetical protein